MTLRTRTLWLIGIALVGLLAVLYLTSSFSLMQNFVALEAQATRQQVAQARDALSNNITMLRIKAIDWSNWDDTYAFIEDHNAAYIISNLTDKALSELHLNAVVFLNAAGQVVYSKGYDLQQGIAVPVSPQLLARLAPGGALLALTERAGVVSGLLPLPEGPLVITLQPILTSEGAGPRRGTLIFAQYLNAPAVAQLAETTHLSLSVQPFNAPDLPAEFVAARASLGADETAIVVQPLDETAISGYARLNDLLGQPAVLVRVDSPRLIYQQGQAALRVAVLYFLLFGLVLFGLTLWLLDRLILLRLARLTSRVSQIGAQRDFSTRVPVEGRDEIAQLAGTLNHTLENLEQSHSLLQTTFESTTAGIFAIDAAGRLVTTNRQFFGLWGLAPSQVTLPERQWPQRLAEQTVDAASAGARFQHWLSHPDRQGSDEFELRDGRILECSTVPQRAGGADGKIIGRVWDCRDITSRKRVEATLQRQMGELITLRDIALIGSEATTADSLVELATKIIGANLYPTEILNIGLVEKATGQLQILPSHYVRGDIPGHTLPPGQGIIGRVVTTGQAQIVPNTRQDPAYVPINPDIASEICVPLKVGRNVLGVLNVESLRPAAFGEADERLLTILAGQLATALETVRMTAEVQRLATTDGLTELYNRRHFFLVAQRELERARRYGRSISAIMLDLDHFKGVNDTYGHAAGDLVLKTVAQYCRKNLRETDLVGRYGGEEFVALLTEASSAAAQEAAERLRSGIAQLAIGTPQGTVTITASLGLATLDKTHPDLDKLLDCADHALYQAKHDGRNRLRVWQPEPQPVPDP